MEGFKKNSIFFIRIFVFFIYFSSFDNFFLNLNFALRQITEKIKNKFGLLQLILQKLKVLIAHKRFSAIL